MIENTILQVALGGLFGAIAGMLYLAALRYNVALYTERPRLPAALALHVIRLAAIGGLMWLLAQIGAAPLLAAAAGFALARLGVASVLRNRPC